MKKRGHENNERTNADYSQAEMNHATERCIYRQLLWQRDKQHKEKRYKKNRNAVWLTALSASSGCIEFRFSMKSRSPFSFCDEDESRLVLLK